jgi:alkylation response protein AidB-like acyl-CoA dehydrogenase
VSEDPSPPVPARVAAPELVELRHETLLAEVRAKLAGGAVRRELARLPASARREPDPRPLYAELGRLGLLAVDWPPEHGGGGRTFLEAALVAQELARAGVPDTLHVNTIQIVGLFLLLAGTPEQRARYLPPFARGESFASVLYTEPGAGSDLASLRAEAVADADGFRIRGVKVFSLKSHLTDVGLCAARTSEAGTKYEGLTLFLVDLAGPGVRRSTIASIADEDFHRVELHDVHVARDAVVGEVGQGWPLLAKALTLERTGLDYTGKAERWLRAATELDGRVDDAFLVEAGRLAATTQAARALTWQVLQDVDAAAVTEGRAAAAKYCSSEVAQRVAQWAAGAHGLGCAVRGLRASSRSVLEAAYREAPGLTISAGSSEMMLQLIASAEAEGTAEPIDADPLHADLRAALRSALQAVAVVTDPHAAPASHGAASPAWPVLVRLRAPSLEVPASLGGLELGLEAAAVACEEVGRAGLGSPYPAVALAIHALSHGPVRRRRLLDRLVAGTAVAALGGFEGEAVSGAFGACACHLRGSAVVSSEEVDALCLRVRLAGKPVLVVLERDELPVEPQPLRDGGALLKLDGACVPLEAIHPLPPDGEVAAAAEIRQAAYLLGLAEGARAEAARYADDRRQFGQALRSFQAVSFRLADTQARLQALRLLVAAAAELADAGLDASARAIEALALAAETTLDVCRTAMQLCGARALTGETALHRFARLARTEAVRLGVVDERWRDVGSRLVRTHAATQPPAVAAVVAAGSGRRRTQRIRS